MKLKNVLLSVMSLALVAVVAIGGTLAYLTDRDSKANVFTVGDVEIELNEDFKQGAELIPGVKVEKEATITNTGDNDAWVWMTMAIPAALDDANADTGMDNPLHWNVPGVVWKGYGNSTWATAEKVKTALEKGYITEDMLGDDGRVKDEYLWTVCQEDTYSEESVKIQRDVEIDGVKYNVYTFLYNGALAAGDTTSVGLASVYLDASIDIDPDGQWYSVKNGEATKIEWNSNTNGNPIVYVSAYAMQTNEFDTVLDAYNAYNKQWANNGTEYGTPATVVEVSDLDSLKDALEGEDPVIVDGNGKDLGDLDDVTFEDGTIIRDMTFTGDSSLGSYGNNANGTVTFINCTFTSGWAYAAHFDGGNGELIFIDCKFEGWNSFGTAITGLTFENCTFGSNGNFAIARVYQDATFTDCTFESDFEGVDTNVAGTVVHFNNCTGISTEKIFNNTDDGVVAKGVWYINGVDVSAQIQAW